MRTNKREMIKREIITLAVVLMAFPSFSQNSGEAKALLDKSYAAYEASEGIRLSFTTTMQEPDGSPYMAQSGEAFMEGNRFRLEMETMEIRFDGETQWVWLKEVNEVNVSNPTGEEIAAISPTALLGMYKKGFKLKRPIAQSVNGRAVQLIEMIPGVDHKEYKALSVAIARDDHTPQLIVLTMSNGSVSRIEISDYSTGHQFSDHDFVFDQNAHPGVEVIDLR